MKKAAKAPTKKAKAAVGGTALLGLVTLLCLTGNIPSWPNSASVPAHLDSQVNFCACDTTYVTSPFIAVTAWPMARHPILLRRSA